MGGLRLALSLFTVAPVRADRFDRATARVAMALAPLAGALLGLVLGLLGWAAVALGASPLLAAALVVGAAVLLTRALHVDGLADVADGLGSYAPAERALEIMKKSDIGPFGVVAIALVLLVDTAALSSIISGISDSPGASLGALVVAFAGGRLAATVACRRGLPAARPEGLGSLVAETVPLPLIAVSALVIAGLAGLVDPVRGPVAVGSAVVVAWGLTAHARRRFGGVTGDVIGGAVELSTMAALVVLATA
ncbi:adenosylcobinamide-GDP ribazoletransferase [Dactylosporangium sp. AC04546]|uniref:adenosylcobinamide-GDP ribazoletransferase n=1 Tax=Dactylosporangium sp. AC04546 TaxID=2862460 RepID=UPI001EDE930E|nr:adenosylcobinamide-GDP ribazoletransferase [Dactylosporangium sp. AC04546]WVK82241.1 adenosylcobinamide-GDP ribazoletransferase [Dactylosporangium sp. AC04546]